MTSRAELKARLKGDDGSWGQWASSSDHARYADLAPKRWRRGCGCGCGMRVTHVGCANGLAMMSGCELEVRRWVRDGWVKR